MTYLFLPNSYGLLKQFLIVKEEFANNLQLVSLSRIKKMFNKKFKLKLALILLCCQINDAYVEAGGCALVLSQCIWSYL